MAVADYFLPALLLICAVSTLMMGSSWSTIGTLGVAGMAAGTSMGLSPAAIAGAIVSGAFFGDKMSPLSDTTILASGVAGANIFAHIRHMLYTTIPGLAIALIAFMFMAHSTDTGDLSASIGDVLNGLQANYVISAWLFIIPLLIPVLALSKVPAIPTLIIGIMDSTGMLHALVGKVVALVKSGRTLCAVTVGSSFLTNVVTAEQYISIIIPGRMYADAFREKNLHPKNLSRALEDGGTITSALVPWSTDAVFVYSALGVSAWTYAPYAILNYSVPIISILMALSGVAIVYQRDGDADTNTNADTAKP